MISFAGSVGSCPQNKLSAAAGTDRYVRNIFFPDRLNVLFFYFVGHLCKRQEGLTDSFDLLLRQNDRLRGQTPYGGKNILSLDHAH